MSEGFEGRHVVVTGGTGALGAAVVGRLIAEGTVCHVPVFDPKELEGFAHVGDDRVQFTDGMDLRDEKAVANYYHRLPGLWASIHVTGGFAMSPIAETTLEDFRRMMDLNATTCFLCCREAVRRIRAEKRAKGGRIVNVAARASLVPTGGMIAYTTAKAAVASMTQCLAEEVRDDHIWVNAVVPSIMDTQANRAAMPTADHEDWPTVADVAETIAFLASPANKSTRGALVPVYGLS
ncbi:MAG: SDR family NAD(P)-dependent oxidoreductase [Myxococcales bacterium]|nr:SDR family NAD(P)-dependent oxidoreductase [Myxococcales bacterium]